MKKIGILILISCIVLSCGCIQKVERPEFVDPGRYFPLHLGDEYYFSGPVGHFKVTGLLGNLRTLTYYDSAGAVTHWEDFIWKPDAVSLKNMQFKLPGHAYIDYEPSLPFSPWSNLVGDTLLFQSTEIRSDSEFSHLPIMVGYEILAIESVATPAGIFEDCIKIQITYKTIDNSVDRMLDGRSIWWFAPDIGFVKYETPEGPGELIQATIDGVNISG